jgi:hypothetical protein
MTPFGAAEPGGRHSLRAKMENGRSVGTASPAEANVWRVDGTVRDRHYCDGCDGSCIGRDVSCRDRLNRIAKEKR